MTQPLPGSAPSEDDLFYLEWGKETTKKNIENAHGVLTQFLTLNTALMGGSVVFLSPSAVDKAWQTIALGLFFIGLFISFVGILPHETTANLISPSEIKQHKEIALHRKRVFMWLSAFSTGAGLLAISVAVVYA